MVRVFKASHRTLVMMSGLIWLAIGFYLLPLGVNFIVETLLKENAHRSYPLLHSISPYVGGMEVGALIIVGVGMVIGFFKGRFMLAKAVKRGVDHILTLPNPASLSQVYTKKYYILLGVMVCLGMLAKLTPTDVRGAVDVIIGSALVNGAVLYFLKAYRMTPSPVSEEVK